MSSSTSRSCQVLAALEVAAGDDGTVNDDRIRHVPPGCVLQHQRQCGAGPGDDDRLAGQWSARCPGAVDRRRDHSLATLNPGGGNDTISVPTLGAIAGNLIVHGEAGAVDVMTISDLAATAGRTYTFTGNSLAWGATATMTFDLLESMNFDATNFTDSIMVSSMPAVTTLTANLRSGTDYVQCNVANNTWLVSGAGSGTLN